jgi:hypothetical protein
MSNSGFKNNPLYTDITKLDHLSPQPVFSYNWNSGESRWEPAGAGGGGNLGLASGSIDIGNLSDLISGLSGSINVGLGGDVVSGLLSEISSGIASQTGAIVNIDRIDTQEWKLLTKTVNQKIEEDFILLENIPDSDRHGTYSGNTYGIDRFVMDDIYNTHFSNARTNPSTPETGHPDYFIHAEGTDPSRPQHSEGVFHTDTAYGLRQENDKASPINSYELKDFSELYDMGLAESVLIFNESPYPIQFHTIDETYDINRTDDPENNNIMYLYPDTSVQINSDEAKKVFVKRPHTISGYTVKYTVTYKETGTSDIIY